MRKKRKKKYQNKNIKVELVNSDIKELLKPFMNKFLKEAQGIFCISMDLIEQMEDLKAKNKILTRISSTSLVSILLLFLLLFLK